MSNTTSTNTPPHILVFPYPAQGHMLPLLDLTHQLALRNLTITIVVTPKNLPLLTPLLTLHPNSIQPLILPFPNHPSIPNGVENVKDLPGNYFRPMICIMGLLHQPLLNWFQSQSSPPIAILSDFFLGWTQNLAVQLGIPRIVFSPSGAMAFQVLHSLFREMPEQIEEISFPTIPNSPKYPWWQISPLYRSFKEGDPDSEFLRDCFVANLESWGIVVNSFDELESLYLRHLKLKTSSSPDQQVWAIGPLVPAHDSSVGVGRGRGGSSSIASDSHSLLSWLDTCPDNSVIYVCFGSQAVLNNKQMEELAGGLEKSGTRFVWCVKEPTVGHIASEFGKLPDGFEDRTGGRGIVIHGWAPQVLILGHRAVGAFITHCGWNSVVEAIVAGVPMLTWPMTADQYVNATLLVDQLGAGVRLCEGVETVLSASDLARVLVGSVRMESSERMRVMELSKDALDGIKEGGKSNKELDDLVKRLSQLNSCTHRLASDGRTNSRILVRTNY